MMCARREGVGAKYNCDYLSRPLPSEILYLYSPHLQADYRYGGLMDARWMIMIFFGD